MIKPVSEHDRKIPVQTNFAHYKDVLKRVHANLKQQEDDRIADLDLIAKMEADPTFVDTLPTTKSFIKNNTNPAIYLVDPKHAEGLTLGQAAKKLGISSRSVAMIRQGTPLSIRSLNQMMDYTGLTLKELITPECSDELFNNG